MNKDLVSAILIFVICSIIYAQGLNIHGIEFRDDEVFYVKSTQEMIKTHNYLSPTYLGEDRFQKPILFYWFVMVSYFFGREDWASARLVSVFFASLTVVVSWLLAKELFNRRSAFLSAMILATMPLFFRHAKTAVPDTAFNFFSVLSIYFLVKFVQSNYRNLYSVLFFVSCGLGFMVKGFAGMVPAFSLMIVYPFLIGKKEAISKLNILRGVAILTVIIAPWFLYMICVHGLPYLKYMWFDETAGRLLHIQTDNFLLEKIKTFKDHSLFYLETILFYFAPWSFVGILGAVFLVDPSVRKDLKHPGALISLIWITVTFLFFSFMYFSISHYMLIITTPFAILTGHLIGSNLGQKKYPIVAEKAVLSLMFIFIYCVYSFFAIYILKTSVIPQVLLLLFFIVLMGVIFKAKTLIMPSVIVGLLMMFLYIQAPIFSKVGVTQHARLQKFAQTILKDKDSTYAVGVGSHQLHEKELQVYFDIPVQKVANDHEGYTKYMLNQLFSNNRRVYCLMTENDYNKYLLNADIGPHEIIQKESMFKRKPNLDKGFWQALYKRDHHKVSEYLMEEVILIKRDG